MAAALQRARSNSSVDESSSVSSPYPVTPLSTSSSSSPSVPQHFNNQQQREQHSETYSKENNNSKSTPTGSDETNSHLNRLNNNNNSYLNDDDDIVTKAHSLTNTPIKDSYRTLPKKAVKKQTKTITANEMKRPFPLTSISTTSFSSPKSSPYQFTAYRKKYDSNDSTSKDNNSNSNPNISGVKATFRLRSYTSDNPTPPTPLQSVSSTVNSDINSNYHIPKFSIPTIKTGITTTPYLSTPPTAYRSLYSSSSTSTTPNSTPKLSISKNRVRGFKKSSGSDVSSPYSSMYIYICLNIGYLFCI